MSDEAAPSRGPVVGDRAPGFTAHAEVSRVPTTGHGLFGGRPVAFDARLVKGERTRRYHIRPCRSGTGEWCCQVWFGESEQHRGDVTRDQHQVERLYWQYKREIDELLLDGWAIVEATLKP